jgi:hypothetical protein
MVCRSTRVLACLLGAWAGLLVVAEAASAKSRKPKQKEYQVCIERIGSSDTINDLNVGRQGCSKKLVKIG